MRRDFRFEPGWATPIAIDHRNLSFLSWLLGGRKSDNGCLARRQGRCPGLNQCHDCAWSPQRKR